MLCNSVKSDQELFLPDTLVRDLPFSRTCAIAHPRQYSTISVLITGMSILCEMARVKDSLLLHVCSLAHRYKQCIVTMIIS